MIHGEVNKPLHKITHSEAEHKDLDFLLQVRLE